MNLRSTTTKALAAVTAAGVLTLGGGAVAFAAEGGAGERAGGSGTIVRQHPGVLRNAVKVSFTAAAERFMNRVPQPSTGGTGGTA